MNKLIALMVFLPSLCIAADELPAGSVPLEALQITIQHRDAIFSACLRSFDNRDMNYNHERIEDLAIKCTFRVMDKLNKIDAEKRGQRQ